MFSQGAHRSFPAISCWKEENNENISTLHLREQIVRDEIFAIKIHSESASEPGKRTQLIDPWTPAYSFPKNR